MPSTVTVHYPFHPHHKCCLDVVAWPRKANQAATVRDPFGETLKIPLWMLDPAAAQHRLSEVVTLPVDVLLTVASLLEAHTKVTAPQSPEQRRHAPATGVTGLPLKLENQ